MTLKDTLSPERLYNGLLEPIPGDNPFGENLRYGPTHEAILKAREEDDTTIPTGVWQHDIVRADWHEVADLCRSALTDKSKDLQIAGWLVEAGLHIGALTSLRPGLEFIADLLTRYWDGLYPLHDGEEDSPRFSPIVWLDTLAANYVQTMPLVEEEIEGEPVKISLTDYALAQRNEAALAKRDGEAAAESRPAQMVKLFRESAERLPLDTLNQWWGTLEGITAAARRIEAILDDRHGPSAPGLGRTRAACEDLTNFIKPIVVRRKPDKGLRIPALLRVKSAEADGETATEAADHELTDRNAEQGAADFLKRERTARHPMRGTLLETREDAYEQLEDIADFLKRVEPHSLTPALLLRAVRWGRMSLGEVIVEMQRDGHDMRTIEWLLNISDGN